MPNKISYDASRNTKSLTDFMEEDEELEDEKETAN